MAGQPGASERPRDARATRLVVLGLTAAVLVAYTPTWAKESEFVNSDDDDFVTANPHVQAGLSRDGLRWAVTTTHAYYYQPPVWLSLQLDAELFGTTARVFHRTNTLLHLGNALLLFFILRRMTGRLWPSALVAALFALHPLCVESVAWVAERKNVLSTFFGLLTMAAYVRYAVRPSVWRYLLVAALFAVGLITKPTLVTLPAALLLLDYWPLERWRPGATRGRRAAPASLAQLIVEKLPLLAMTVPVILVTLEASAGLVRTTDQFPLSVRLENASVSYVKYVLLLVWPVNLAMFYPHPGRSIPLWQVLASATMLAATTWYCLREAARGRRYLAVGWLWYLGTLVPMIGLVQVCNQELADHYAYVPMIGILIVVAWGLADLCPAGSPAVVPVALAAGVALLVLTVLTRSQAQTWRNSETLWRHAIAVTGGNQVAYTHLGLALAEKGKFEDAITYFEQAVARGPHERLYHNLGMAYAAVGRYDEAGAQFEAALRIDPNQPASNFRLGLVRDHQGRFEEAVRHLTVALASGRDTDRVRLALAGALERKKDFAAARAQYELLSQSDPASAQMQVNIGRMLKLEGKATAALQLYERVLKVYPDCHEAWNNKGVALEELARFPAAADCYRRAVELEPENLVYRLNLAFALHTAGRPAEAAEEYEAATRLRADWPKLLMAEAWALATHPDPGRRNGAQALRSARMVCQVTDFKLAPALDLMAAAHAELGQFEDAVKWQKKTLALLPDKINPEIRAAVMARLALYERRQPYRDTNVRG